MDRFVNPLWHLHMERSHIVGECRAGATTEEGLVGVSNLYRIEIET